MSTKPVAISTKVVVYLILLAFSGLALFPIVRIISISLRPVGVLHSTSLAFLVDDWTFAAYVRLFSKTDFPLWLRNSLVVSLTVALVGTALASMAGYAFSRFSFRGKQTGLFFLVTTQMFPVTMLLLPLFIMLIKLKLYDSFLGLVIVYSSSALPFCIWQMKGYYDTIPMSLSEAASIDGCGVFSTFFRIILPLVTPAYVITSLFSFMTAWSEYLVAAVVLCDTTLFTLPLGLKSFQSNFDTEWNLYAAAALIVSLPVVILFLLLTRYLISGLTLGSVKG